MSTTKFEHVIGRDGLYRIRKTCVENGEIIGIIGITHEGMTKGRSARENEALNFTACLRLVGFPHEISTYLGNHLISALESAHIVDEREPNVACTPYMERPVADPLEPQTKEPHEQRDS